MNQQYTMPSELLPRHPGLEALDDGFCMLDPQWRVTYWNRAAERLVGLDRARVLGREIWDVLPALREGETRQQLEQVAEERLPRRFLQDLGRRHVASVYAAPMDCGGLALHFRDATEEVRRSEQYDGLLESIRDGFVAVDRNWTIVYLNSLAESLLRFPRERAVGRSIWPLISRRWSDVADCLRATMNDGLQRHLREVRPDARALRGKVFDLWTLPLAGGGISILFEDVSERVQRERDLARFAAEAQEANHAKSRFFAAVSHELRTPLNAIVGYTHLLETATYGEMPAPAKRAAERASVCAEHLARLVDDVLLMTTTEFTRLTVSPEELDLDGYLPSVLEPLRHQAEAKRLEFGISVHPATPRVFTDAQRLRQLLVAVVSNAVRYTSRGTVSIEVRMPEDGTGLDSGGETYSLFPEPLVEILIADTGPGIPHGHRERIFGAFEQLNDPARSNSMVTGTGLGLPIARRLAHLLRGSLDLTDSSPSGSTFRLRLPLRIPYSS